MLVAVELSVCLTDDDYEAWRLVRLAVLPGERCDTVAEMRQQDAASRLLLLASLDGEVVGIGAAGLSQSAGIGFVAPRVLPEHRRRGVGTALLRALSEHCAGLGLSGVRAGVEDEGSLAFASHFGFVEVDRQVEQVRTIRVEQPPPAPPSDTEVVTLSERPRLWAECFETFGKEVLADFAVYAPLHVTADEWDTGWRAEPMFLALHDGEVVGCAGLDVDPDQPRRAEHALTAVRRGWRGRGLATHLKLCTLHWAATNGLSEVYTWTQAGNAPMLTLNERLGYVRGGTSITVSRRLRSDR